MSQLTVGINGWERVASAVEKVKERLQRATTALGEAGVPYAVIGGNAVAEWVGRVDEAAVRYTQDVDLLLREEDLEAAKSALEAIGFVYRHAASIDMFLDGPGAKARDAVHIIHARKKVRPDYDQLSPDVTESEPAVNFQVLSLEALVRMKLTSYRDKDRTHIRDLLDVGLIDASWPARLPLSLGSRLQHILDTPES